MWKVLKLTMTSNVFKQNFPQLAGGNLLISGEKLKKIAYNVLL